MGPADTCVTCSSSALSFPLLCSPPPRSSLSQGEKGDLREGHRTRRVTISPPQHKRNFSQTPTEKHPARSLSSTPQAGKATKTKKSLRHYR